MKPFNRNYNNAVHDSPKRTSPNEKAVKVDQNTQILNSEEVIFLEHKRLLNLCVQNNAFHDAQILCERLIQVYGPEENSPRIPTENSVFHLQTYAYAVYILARSFYLRGLTNQARLVYERYRLPRPGSGVAGSEVPYFSQARLQYAQCLYDLAKYAKVQEVLLGKEACLFGSRHQSSPFSESLAPKALASAQAAELRKTFEKDQLPFALRLLAFCHVKLGRHSTAKQIFQQSLQLFPLLWSSIEGYFATFTRDELRTITITQDLPFLLKTHDHSTWLRKDDESASFSSSAQHILHVGDSADKIRCARSENPTSAVASETAKNTTSKRRVPRNNSKENNENCVDQESDQSLANSPSDSQADSSNPHEHDSIPPESPDSVLSSKYAKRSLLCKFYQEYCQYFHTIASTYLHYQKDQYENCIRASYNTDAWSSSLSYKFRGLSAYQLQRYDQSIDIFMTFRNDFTYLTDGCDFLSSALWHLKRRKQLASLTRELRDVNVNTPESWISLGNLLSLEKLKSRAIQAFQRAVELSIPVGMYPDLKAEQTTARWTGGSQINDQRVLSYALCLLGHEMFDYNDTDGALKCYSHAIIADKQFYQAYYGIGAIYMHKEEYSTAERYLRYAVHLHPKSAMVNVNLAQAQASQRKYKDACETLKHACLIDPLNTQCKYYLARNLMLVQDYNKAREIAEQVKVLAPKEPSIYELLAKIYLKVGKKVQAITCANLAVAYGKGMYDSKNSTNHNSTAASSQNGDLSQNPDDTFATNVDFEMATDSQHITSPSFPRGNLHTPGASSGRAGTPGSEGVGEPRQIRYRASRSDTFGSRQEQPATQTTVPSYLRDEIEQDMLYMEYS